MFHLTQRVAWHDSNWTGTICLKPSNNSYCISLDRIRGEREGAKEDKAQGCSWSDLSQNDLPSCIAESAGFMNSQEWSREFRHPYSKNKKTKDTHGHLKPTTVKVPRFATFSVPFGWMLREHQKTVEEGLPTPLPSDKVSPFPSPWVFGRERQEALLDLMFGRISPEHSLVFFYCKEGQPVDESISRLVVGVGRILSVGQTTLYESDQSSTYPLWDRVVRHSIRPEGTDGFLMPYHEYLEPTGDSEEDERRRRLLKEIAIVPESTQIRSFSYAAELARADIALATLVQCLEAVRKIREHGIAKGPWPQREEWLNQQIASIWESRGAFPGTGSALEALGMRLGTSLHLELMASGALSSEENPWGKIDQIIRGEMKPPQPAYEADLKAVRQTWINLSDERKELFLLLSRMDLSPKQTKRWFNEHERNRATKRPVNDAEIIGNPYRIVECDLGDDKEPPVTLGTVDRALLPEDTIRAKHPVPEPSHIGSLGDARRIRAALVTVLSQAAVEGDALLSITETLELLELINQGNGFHIGQDWIFANREFLSDEIVILEIPSKDSTKSGVAALQLCDLKRREESLRKILAARARKELPSLKSDWTALVKKSIEESKSLFDEKNDRHIQALKEQSYALERLTTHKLSALTGKAGTGKTSVLGALLRCEDLVQDGILLLAPTGKARVRLGKAADAEAMTIAQFLYGLGRFDGIRQRPLFSGKEKYRKEKTVVIDECSMLTMDDLLAVFEALDLAHVQRLILVGDPNQLPPIGVGRPFADLVGYLEKMALEDDPNSRVLGSSLARLFVEVRTAVGAPSDTLRLASWFSREPQMVDSDRVLSEMELGSSFNDLEICFWNSPDELRATMLSQFQKYLDLNGAEDVDGFNAALGLDEKGWVPFDSPDGSENFQVLSPVRRHYYGVYALNRWIQQHFRKKELLNSRQGWGKVSLSDEEIVCKDKIIQTRNQKRKFFDGQNEGEEYLANGEIGMAATGTSKFLNIAFAGRPNKTFGYRGKDFPRGKGPLELAYVLTIHKSQGSEFQKVFVVLPKDCPLVSRELLYTALTRAKEKLILLIEGDNVSALYDLTRPEKSETARRNTNLFVGQGAVRERSDLIPYADHLIHRTDKGHMVRSKSELVIANKLFQMNLNYEYERVLEGTSEPGRLRPDFSFVDPAGDLIIWEHLGMLFRVDYQRSWEWKKAWYQKNGFVEGVNLFTTFDDENGGLDSSQLTAVADKIENMV